MFILNGMGTEIINTDHVIRFTLVQKNDATLITAVFHDNFTTIGRYTERNEAELAMAELMEAISDGRPHFMRGNTGPYLPNKKQHGYHGQKTIGHGGS